MIRQWIAAITLASCSAAAFAQLNLPTRNIGGVDYYYRIVQKKETIYGIARELNIPKEDIVKYNPSVATGLKKDQVLYFPVDAYVKRQAVVRPKCTDSLSPNCCKQTPKQGPDLKQTLC